MCYYAQMPKKTKEKEDIEMLEDEQGGESRVYELAFHLDPELTENEAKKTFERIKEAISEVSTHVAEGAPVKIPLAYTVSRMETAGRKDFTSSYFAWIAYEADGKSHETIGEMARNEKSIFRFLDLKTTKEEAKHAEEMQEIARQTEREQEVLDDADVADSQGEEVIDEELEKALKQVGVV